MNRIKVLFVCIHNSARSQMAEAFLKHYGGELFQVESAGLEPGKLNPYVIRVMAEKGIDISRNKTNSVFDYFKEGRTYNFLITVCDESNRERCPIFPGRTQRIHWGFPDPGNLRGKKEEILEGTRIIRDKIEKAVKDFVERVQAEFI